MLYYKASAPHGENQDPTCLAAKIPKHKTSNIVTNSIKTLKMVNIKKTFKKKKKILELDGVTTVESS